MDHHHTYKFYMKQCLHVNNHKYSNSGNFEVISDKFSLVGLYTSEYYEQKGSQNINSQFLPTSPYRLKH